MSALKLKGHRLQQLQLLNAAGAVSRGTAVCVSMDREFRPVTLCAMIGEGLVEQAQLTYKGDSRRRLSHYWLTGKGWQVAMGEGRAQ